MYVCLSICTVAHGGQERVSDPRGLELQVVMSQHTGAGNKT